MRCCCISNWKSLRQYLFQIITRLKSFKTDCPKNFQFMFWFFLFQESFETKLAKQKKLFIKSLKLWLLSQKSISLIKFMKNFKLSKKHSWFIRFLSYTKKYILTRKGSITVQVMHFCMLFFSSTPSREANQIKKRKKKFLCIFNFHLQLINWIAAMISCFRSFRLLYVKLGVHKSILSMQKFAWRRCEGRQKEEKVSLHA